MPAATPYRSRRSGEVDFPRLTQAIRASRLASKVFRDNRREAVRLIAGGRYSEDGTLQDQPANLLALYAAIVGRALVAKNPRVMLTTSSRKGRPAVAAMQGWANRQIERQDVGTDLRRAVFDAFFYTGVCKVGLATPAEAMASGWAVRGGQPFVSSISFDNYYYDHNAMDPEDYAYEGHGFRVPLEAVRDDGKTYLPCRKKVTASRDSRYGDYGTEKTSTVGRGYAGDRQEYQPMADLVEVYLPREKLVATLWQTDDGTLYDDPLRVVEHVGPYCGPYHRIGFQWIPDCPIAKGPVMDLMPAHEMNNRTMRKLFREADACKTLGFYDGADDGFADKVRTAGDLDFLRADRPDSVKMMTLGGPNAALTLFAQQTQELFNYLAGNMEAMGGLSPQAKTLGQDQLLSAGATRTLADMQEESLTFQAKVLSSLCWFWWNHPTLETTSEYTTPYLKRDQFSAEMKSYPRRRPGYEPPDPSLAREQSFEELDLRVDPYNLSHQTPQTKLAALRNVMTQVVVPLSQALQAQGKMVDVGKYLELEAEWGDMPELREIVTIAAPPPTGVDGPGMSADQVPGPANTTRTYQRVSSGGQGQERQTKTQALIQQANRVSQAVGSGGVMNQGSKAK